jgi:hypothetical protein
LSTEEEAELNIGEAREKLVYGTELKYSAVMVGTKAPATSPRMATTFTRRCFFAALETEYEELLFDVLLTCGLR